MSYRILFVIDNYDISGAEKIAINFMRHCNLAGIDAEGIVCMDDKIGVELSGVHLIHLNPDAKIGGSLLQRIIKGISATVKSVRYAKRFDALVAVTPPAAVVALIAGLLSRKPVIPWLHYDINGISREGFNTRGRIIRNFIQYILYHFFIPCFRNIICVSQGCLDSLRNRYGKFFNSNGWVVLPNILDPSSFDETSPSSTFLYIKQLKAQQKPLFLFLGRIYRQKRWEDAIAAAEIMSNAGFDFNLAFIGDGIELDRFSAALQSSTAKHRLHYLGSDINPIPSLQIADALIMTSLYEAWPTVILEAFHFGVLVFAYDCPSGPREMLGEGSRGITTEERPQAMAEALMKFFNSSDYCKSKQMMIANAREFLKNYTPEVACLQWKAYFEKLLQAGIISRKISS